ncbi:hypothetical protein AJ80_08220 [Polytolypa hystricis UAMH7299]|uniref:Mediator of RNA polymerase II transcription subunit 17 n=1 Tax=Polytolypa hystricis (strain UAMH7299) TaxID=1447883 RepID=A0A2B7X383_POLH7|nr:hypothetical protein AJ80_08220 [Polytolypa hystricis UAMH7299]
MVEESFTLPLRPPTRRPSNPDSLATRIAQINAQRGSFRNVTEEGLQTEIDTLQAAGLTGDEEEEPESCDTKSPDRLEQLYKSRMEIIQFAAQAHAEATYALDFVSLLLSKHTPRQAEISMSPILKQKAPLGSLDVDVIKQPEQSESSKKDIDTVSRGWKLENFDCAANKILKSATRLEEEVAAETKYWAEVLSIKEKGWKISRLPRERQTLGVHFGLLEATPIFRDRGLAALRRANGGDLLLDQGLHVNRPRAMRVRVQENGHTVGSSPVKGLPSQPENLVESRIRHARDSLYEEELFHELNREARALLQHGIETKHNLVQFKASDTQQILIDLVDLNNPDLDVYEMSKSRAEDNLAESLATSLRILLSYAHRQNLRRRTQIPPPLKAGKRPTPEFPLLGPIVCFLQHRSEFQWMRSFLDDLRGTLKSAGLSFWYTASPASSINQSNPPSRSTPPPQPPSPIESLVSTFIGPMESFISGTFLSETSGFRLRISTHVAPNGYGTEFELFTNLPCMPGTNTTAPQRFGLRSELQDYMLYLFTIDLVYLIPPLSGNVNSPVAQTTHTHSHFRADTDDDEEDDIEDTASQPLFHLSSLSTITTYLAAWEPTFAKYGELTAYCPSRRRTKKLRVDLRRDRLVLRSGWVGGSECEGDEEGVDRVGRGGAGMVTDGKGAIAYVWRPGTGEEEEEEESKVKIDDGSEGEKSLQSVVLLMGAKDV